MTIKIQGTTGLSILGACLSTLVLGLPLTAAPLLNIAGQVLAPGGGNGSSASANSHARIYFVREGLADELAQQIDAKQARNQVFSTPGRPAYFLADVGSQWHSPAVEKQAMVVLAEALPGVNGWQGEACVAASRKVLSRADLNTGLAELSKALELAPIPVPALQEANGDFVRLSIPAFHDAQGLAHGLRLSRRLAAGPGTWIGLASLPLPSATSPTAYIDLSVTPEAVYEYGVNVEFTCNGAPNGLLVSNAQALSAPIKASRVQPSPERSAIAVTGDLKDGWEVYPNPAHGPSAHFAFDAPSVGAWHLQVFNILAERVLEANGTVSSMGRQDLMFQIAHLSSGVYLVRLEFTPAEKQGTTVFAFKKLAILK